MFDTRKYGEVQRGYLMEIEVLMIFIFDIRIEYHDNSTVEIRLNIYYSKVIFEMDSTHVFVVV